MQVRHTEIPAGEGEWCKESTENSIDGTQKKCGTR